MKTQNGGEERRYERRKERVSKMEEEEERKKMARWRGRGELIRIGMDSKSRWWKTFWLRAFQHRRALASRENSRGKMAPAQRDTENA